MLDFLCHLIFSFYSYCFKCVRFGYYTVCLKRCFRLLQQQKKNKLKKIEKNEATEKSMKYSTTQSNIPDPPQWYSKRRFFLLRQLKNVPCQRGIIFESYKNAFYRKKIITCKMFLKNTAVFEKAPKKNKTTKKRLPDYHPVAPPPAPHCPLYT